MNTIGIGSGGLAAVSAGSRCGSQPLSWWSQLWHLEDRQDSGRCSAEERVMKIAVCSCSFCWRSQRGHAASRRMLPASGAVGRSLASGLPAPADNPERTSHHRHGLLRRVAAGVGRGRRLSKRSGHRDVSDGFCQRSRLQRLDVQRAVRRRRDHQRQLAQLVDVALPDDAEERTAAGRHRLCVVAGHW